MTSPQLPVFYINLASRPDRRAFMERQLLHLGITFERIEATTIEQVPEERLAVCTDPDAPWRIVPAAVACGLSHLRAWQAIVDRNLPAALVLEDDVVMDRSVLDYLSGAAFAGFRTPLLRLETWGSPTRLSSTRIAHPMGSVAARMITTQPGAAAYVIGRDAARASVDDPSALRMEIDRYLFGRGGRWLVEAPIAQAVPAPCVQLGNLESEEGSVTESNIGRAPAGPKRFSAVARRLRKQANGRYLAHLCRALLADPAALFRRPAPVPFAGTATSRSASAS